MRTTHEKPQYLTVSSPSASMMLFMSRAVNAVELARSMRWSAFSRQAWLRDCAKASTWTVQESSAAQEAFSPPLREGGPRASGIGEHVQLRALNLMSRLLRLTKREAEMLDVASEAVCVARGLEAAQRRGGQIDGSRVPGDDVVATCTL